MPKLAFEFNPFERSDAVLSKENKRRAAKEIQTFIVEAVLADIGDGTSPVQGGDWKRGLSKDYKKEKGKVSSSVFANLELTGDMLDSLDVRIVSGKKMSLEVPASQAQKADGNNRGTYGKGTRTQPKRARTFIPYKKGQTFTKEIWEGINGIIEEFAEED